MARYLGPKCKISRREGTDLYLKSCIKNISEKCKIKNFPGQHSNKKNRLSDYGVQFREKQKVKRMYGILERQFKKYYIFSARKKGNTAENLILFLERRLDNVVYRMGFGSTRAESRQLVSHKTVLLNNKVCNISSCILNYGDKISISKNGMNQIRVINSIKLSRRNKLVSWISVDYEKMVGIFKSEPDRNEILSKINEHLIIELYSK